MDTEILGIVLAMVLPPYPMLSAIYHKSGKYNECVGEFKKLRDDLFARGASKIFSG